MNTNNQQVITDSNPYLFEDYSLARVDMGITFRFVMIQLRVKCSQLSFYAMKAYIAGQLGITHDKELVTASEPSCMKIPSISLNTFPELVLRNGRLSCENTEFLTFISCAILYMRQYEDTNSNRILK